MSHSSPHARGKDKRCALLHNQESRREIGLWLHHSSQPSKPGVLLALAVSTCCQPCCCLVTSMLFCIIIPLKVLQTDVLIQHGEQHSQSKQAACKYDLKHSRGLNHLKEDCTVLFALKARTPYAPWPNLFASKNIISVTSQHLVSTTMQKLRNEDTIALACTSKKT